MIVGAGSLIYSVFWSCLTRHGLCINKALSQGASSHLIVSVSRQVDHKLCDQ